MSYICHIYYYYYVFYLLVLRTLFGGGQVVGTTNNLGVGKVFDQLSARIPHVRIALVHEFSGTAHVQDGHLGYKTNPSGLSVSECVCEWVSE